MKISCKQFELELKHPFSISKFTRTSTPLLLIKLDYEGFTGYGEASMVPYMGESHTTAAAFLAKVDFSRFQHPFNFAEIHAYLDEIEKGNPAVKAAIDIALNDLNGKILNQPCAIIYGADKNKMPITSYTLGIDTPEVLKEKVADAKGFKVLKIKLGRDNDKELIQTIRSVSDLPLYVDANQGWSFDDALFALSELADQNIEFCEQPMRKYYDDYLPALCAASPIAIMADESVFTHHDARRLIATKSCHSINIKFSKSGGIHEAIKIHAIAKANNIPCMMGGMLESRLALSAKMHFAMAMDNVKYYDMDTCLLGHLEDPIIGGVQFNGMHLSISDTPGIGAEVDPAYLAKLDHFTV